MVEQRARKRWRGWLIGFLVLLAAGLLVAWGIVSRRHAEAEVKQRTDAAAVPNVATTDAKAGPVEQEITLPGTAQALSETPIYARTSGYLKAWYTDIGTPVKKGQLLAEIDTPDVDDQLRQAKADFAVAVANNALAQSTAQRWRGLLKTQSVSAQETDEKIGDARAKAAALQASEANVARLSELESFKRIVAPFDGVVTARDRDIGALIEAGSGPGPELFRVADKSRLRIYVQVPQSYAAAVKPDLAVDLSFPEYPGRKFKAVLARSSGALDPTQRSLLVELQADNRDGLLFPGGYAEVHMTLPSEGQSVRLPVSTLLFRSEGLRVATVGADDKVTLHPITIGRDFGQEIEVLTGVETGAKVIVNPPDSLVSGETVRVAPPPKKGPEGGQKPEDQKPSGQKTSDQKADAPKKSDRDPQKETAQ